MPEGPEVTFLTDFIRRKLYNTTLTSISILKGRYVNHGPPKGYLEFSRRLPLRCSRVENKGKVIFMYFDNGWCIVSKLGMTGWWYEQGAEPTWKTVYPNVTFHTSKGELLYSDFRNFGTLSFLSDQSAVNKELSSIAPDVLANTTDWRLFKKQLGNVSKAKAQWLMEDALIDQKLIVSGIGNYLKSEILYQAKISPKRKVVDVSMKEWYSLFHITKTTVVRMSKALAKKSTNAYEDAMMVYMKEKDPMGNAIHVTYSKNGRATYWVPRLQK